LDVVMALTERAGCRFANGGERFGEQVVELFTVGEPLPQQFGLAPQFVVGKRVDVRFEGVDRIDILAEAADVAIVGRSEDALCHCGEHGIPLNTRAFRKGENLSPTLWETVAGDVRSGLAVVN